MAKVYQDPKRMGLYLRLLFAMERMNKRANDVVKAMTGFSHSARKFSPRAIRIDLPEEFDETWKVKRIPEEVLRVGRLAAVGISFPKEWIAWCCLPSRHVDATGYAQQRAHIRVESAHLEG
jgi:hypothetical protein